MTKKLVWCRTYNLDPSESVDAQNNRKIIARQLTERGIAHWYENPISAYVSRFDRGHQLSTIERGPIKDKSKIKSKGMHS